MMFCPSDAFPHLDGNRAFPTGTSCDDPSDTGTPDGKGDVPGSDHNTSAAMATVTTRDRHLRQRQCQGPFRLRGCNSGAGTPTANCPEPGSGYGGGIYHRGMFDYYGGTPPVRFKDVQDGLSHTILLGHTSGIVNDPDLTWSAATGSFYGTSLPINYLLKPCLQSGGMMLGVNCGPGGGA